MPPNKRMKLTKLSPVPFRGWRYRLMPAPARLDAGTASQLIRGVRWTQELPRGHERMDGMPWRRVRSVHAERGLAPICGVGKGANRAEGFMAGGWPHGRRGATLARVEWWTRVGGASPVPA